MNCSKIGHLYEAFFYTPTSLVETWNCIYGLATAVDSNAFVAMSPYALHCKYSALVAAFFQTRPCCPGRQRWTNLFKLLKTHRLQLLLLV